jgi:class 3 adenylate cyclase
MTEQRRLATIVSADVAGYSRLIGRDESRVLERLGGNSLMTGCQIPNGPTA